MMTAKPTHKDSGVTSDLLAAAEDVARTGKRRVIRKGRRPLAVLVPYEAPVRANESADRLKERSRRARRKTGVLTFDDPFFRLVGIGASGIPGGVSGRKHEALARAYRPK